MKLIYIFFNTVLLTLLMTVAAAAQTPQFINFQGIATDDNGQIMAGTNLQVRLTVIDSALAGQQVYQELRALQTNNSGSFSFQIGKKPDFTPVGIFKNINWLSGNKYIRVDYDPTNSLNFNYTLGLIRVVSVPYALAAGQIIYIDSTGVQNGQTLVYNQTSGKFQPGAIQSGNLNQGTGISISGNTINNIGDLNPANEIQTISRSNDTIYLSQGSGYAIMPPQGSVNLLPPYAELLTPVGITADSVRFIGVVNPKGMAAHVTFDWGKTTDFEQSALAAQSTVYGMNNVNVSLTVSGLENATTYYYRMKATNAVGDTVTAAGNFISGTSLATLQTLEVSNISGISAIVRVHVTSNGGTPITARGVCWSTSPLPALTASHTTEAGDTGVFNTVMIGLDTCTVYYVRAYATTSLGTTYGQELIFNSGYIMGFTHAGGLVFYNDGQGRGLIASPVLASATASYGCPGQLMGTSTGIYAGKNNTNLIVSNCSTYTVANLAKDFFNSGYDDWYLPSKDELNLIYSNLKAQNIGSYPTWNYASSSEADSNNVWYQNFVYGPQIAYFKTWSYYNVIPVRSFTTNCTPVNLPMVNTASVFQISTSAAKCTGVITDNSSDFIIAKGICWSTSPNPTLNNNFSTNGTSDDAFTHHITGLQPNTTYYARAYATNKAGTAYGNTLTFITFSASNRIYTFSPSNVTGARCTTGGHIADDLGDSITARGICYKTSHDPTLSNLIINSGSDTGSFTIQMRDLHPHTMYYVRAFGICAGDTIFGNEVFFKTTGHMIIGDRYQGGIVYYVDQTGEHGLVAAETDVANNIGWGCFGQYFGANATGIFTGQANTTAIVSGCTTPGIPARLCNDLVLNGYSNWYMPSKDELYYMYANLHLTGLSTFATGWYASSSELNGNAFSGYDIPGNNAYGVLSKLTSMIHVRAINSF